jgi:carbonic anhydrase/acetyltransferase-like protein (isoleucine patch superfamily)
MPDLDLLLKIKSDSSVATKDITGLRSHVTKEVAAIKQSGTQDFASFRKAFDSEMNAMDGTAKNVGLKIAQSFDLSAEGAARLVNGAKLAATAVVAIGAVAIGAGIGIFSLVKNVSEAIDDLADLSAQTNINIETLSALRNMTEDAGGEIGATSAALVFFQRQMYDANDATSKQGKLFRALSVDTKDTEKAIRDAFRALFQMGESFEQTEAAAQLFGARGGKQVLGLIKESNGNLDASIEKYRTLKTLVGEDAAEAANKFQKELIGLQQQLRGVTTEVAISLMPTIGDAIGDISDWLQDNRQTVIAWANSFITTVKNLASTLGPIIGGLIESLGTLNDILNLLKTGNTGQLQLRVAGAIAPLVPQMSKEELEAYKQSNPEYARWREEFDRTMQQKFDPASKNLKITLAFRAALKTSENLRFHVLKT